MQSREPPPRASAEAGCSEIPCARRDFLATAFKFGSLVVLADASAWETAAGAASPLAGLSDRHGMPPHLIPASDDPASWPAWRQQLNEWRATARQRPDYDDRLYRRPEFAWVRSCFSCCLVMLWDETFYDGRAGRYTVDAFLDQGQLEFGGYDALVLWHAYPRIGFDARNQFDFYRDMPGGLAGLREVSRTCRARGVRVFLDYNPWDTGTRRENGSDLDALARLVKEIEADGVFLDTMSQGAAGFRAKLDAARPGVVLESEGALPLDCVHDHHMSWAQGFKDSSAPGVLRNKWFERRHQQHQIARWNRDHTAELHTAWMNGSGMMVWENVFGSWVGWCARDRSILRAMLPIQRRYVDLFTGEGWRPLVPTQSAGVYASLWEGQGLRLWTLVNRAEKPVAGTLLSVPPLQGHRYFDLVAGRELEATPGEMPVDLSGAILPRGIAAFLSGSQAALGADFREFLAGQARLNARADFSTDFPARQTCLKPAARTAKRRSPLADMAAIPAACLEMTTEFRVRECGWHDSRTDQLLVFPGLHRPHQLKRPVILTAYAIDLTPVTNAQFADFLRGSGYRPKHPENFLKHWSNGAPPQGYEQHPVVYVALDDARAFAAWAGKRLPTEDEWQHAAQGPEQRRYPWGDELWAGVCNDGARGSTTPVNAFPDGRSRFGCSDMCGNIWEWTESERSDGRTRYCMLKGGSCYRARGSDWYADGGPQPCAFAAKFLLMWPGLDRCATIGFRCAVDLE